MKDMRERPISYSQLDTYRQCPLKHYLSYVKGFRPDREKEKFTLGTLWHKVMEAHYTVIKAWQDANGYAGKMRYSPQDEAEILRLCAKAVAGVLALVESDEHRQLMEWAYAGYIEQYGADPQWRILAVEIRGEVSLAEGRRPLVYIIDLVVEDIDYGGVWIWDNKFPKDLLSDFEIDLDDQLGLYWLAWSLDPEHGELAARVNGAGLNEARKHQNVGDKPGATKGKAQTLDARFRRTRTDRTRAELKSIRDDALSAMDAMEAGIIYSSPDPRQCKWKCDFNDAHVMSRRSGVSIEKTLGRMGFSTFEEREAARGKAA